ncbi:MAG: acyl-CoA dehydrogenase family protein, partial [Chloroflexota bacterium]|nr:acyl-CoA dehydrogenase family protein [Chloroflexota bacterium]
MDFAVPEETKMLVATMRQFVEKECLPVEQAMMRLNPDWVELPSEPFLRLRSRLKELGLWALDAPREWGGAGLDAVTVVFLTTEQCKTTVGTAHRNPFGSFTDAFFYPAFRHASDYLKERYLYPVIRGEKDSALAQTEPEAGSDAAAIKTTAERDGDYWVINGIKRFSTMADTADFIYVATVTEKGKGRTGHTTFIVDRDTPGLKMLRKIEVIRPQYSTELAFDNVRIHDRQRLTELGAGFRAVQAALGTGRTKLA